MPRCCKQLNSYRCCHNLRGKEIIKLVIQKQGCFVVQLLHDLQSILTTDPVNLDLRTSSGVMHRFQRLCDKYFISVVSVSIIDTPGGGGRISIYTTPAAEQRDPFRRKNTEAQRRDLPGDVWII